MPIQHTVVFRLVHLPGSNEERDFLASGSAALSSIPAVAGFAVHRQVSPKSDLTHRFSMAFDDQAAYDAYNAHPVHTLFVTERWIPEVVDFQEYDFVD